MELWPGGRACEPLGFTPVELGRVDTPLLWDILRDGRAVVPGPAWEEARRTFDALLAAGHLEPTATGGWWDKRPR